MSKYQPALLGGLFIGVMASLPVVQMCCCLWVICGGILVVYLQQQGKPVPVETSEAVLGGLLAGVIGAVIAGLASMLLFGVGGAAVAENMRQSLESNPQITPEMRDNIMRWVSGANFGLILMLMSLPIYAVFSMLGSLLGLAFFRKKTPPAAQPPVMG